MKKKQQSWVKFCNKASDHDDNASSQWDLSHIGKVDEPQFIISQPRQGQPRLLAYVFTSKSFSKLITTTKSSDGYSKQTHHAWTIEKA